MAKKANTANFVEFYMLWGLVNGWQIPDFHITVCEWLGKRPLNTPYEFIL